MGGFCANNRLVVDNNNIFWTGDETCSPRQGRKQNVIGIIGGTGIRIESETGIRMVKTKTGINSKTQLRLRIRIGSERQIKPILKVNKGIVIKIMVESDIA
ncbi:hypothetical protein EVAR_49754_1 [Eumeta japonica]|uniref:Uncharacterized protein n=1 Tax=Eumeta variegata TaxID=151549 RepID=A0A4C1Y9W5_EUMVA|nr:hypothetical protein EVAR_49754_1 [Eumeta japonica]